MKNFTWTLFIILLFLIGIKAEGQCNLTCSQFAINLSISNNVPQSGDPCQFTITIERPSDNLSAPVSSGWYQFTNLTCISCPDIANPPAGTTGSATWILESTNGDCSTGGPFEMGWAGLGCDGSFQLFDLSSCPGGALPVELTSFTGEKTANEAILLSWSTASEENNEGFEVEHSRDGQTWDYLDFVPGFGTTADIQHYDFSHREPAQGTNYYRLKQMDYDGAFEYSDIVSVEVGKSNGGISIAPNPASLNTAFTVQLGKASNGNLRIYNLMGQVIYQMDTSTEIDSYALTLSDAVPGMYMVVFESGPTQFTERLIVNE